MEAPSDLEIVTAINPECRLGFRYRERKEGVQKRTQAGTGRVYTIQE